MAKETRPKDYPKLKNYKPTRFMLPTSHYDDVVNITLHFFLKDIRPMLPPAMNHSIAVS